MARREGLADRKSGPLSGPGVIRTPVTPKSGFVDQWGRPITVQDARAFGPPRDPLGDIDKDKSAGIIHRDSPVIANTFGWDIDSINAALASHDAGYFAGSARLVDAICADDRVQATMGSRLGGLFSQDVIIKPANDSAAAREVADAWAEAWPVCAPQSTLTEVQRWAIMLALSPSEILWDTEHPKYWQPYIKPWHLQHFSYRWDLRRLQANTQDGPVEVNPGDGRWFVHAPHGIYRGWIQAAVRALAVPWLIRLLARRDWSRYSERHGLPMLLADVPAMGDADQRKQFIEDLPEIGQEACIMLPVNVDGTKYDVRMLEAKDRSWESFKGLIESCDMSIVLTLLGQNLTTEVKEGSLAAAREHGDVKQTFLEFDEATLAEDVMQIARPFALFNFGDAELAPSTHWDISPIEDSVAKASVFVSFAGGLKTMSEAGYKFSPENVVKLATSFEITIPEVEVKEPAPSPTAAPAAAASPATEPASPEKPSDEEA